MCRLLEPPSPPSPPSFCASRDASGVARLSVRDSSAAAATAAAATSCCCCSCCCCCCCCCCCAWACSWMCCCCFSTCCSRCVATFSASARRSTASSLPFSASVFRRCASSRARSRSPVRSSFFFDITYSISRLRWRSSFSCWISRSRSSSSSARPSRCATSPANPLASSVTRCCSGSTCDRITSSCASCSDAKCSCSTRYAVSSSSRGSVRMLCCGTMRRGLIVGSSIGRSSTRSAAAAAADAAAAAAAAASAAGDAAKTGCGRSWTGGGEAYKPSIPCGCLPFPSASAKGKRFTMKYRYCS
eukprot:Rhum_TRINITY_DN14765_c12_g1::Rhum_TRINITY_DN14765_c12_g1_i1::g.114414::m.114414